MKKTDEMKEKNEAILKRWRKFGMLDGLKEGSINEWRCAKSFENVAQYCVDNDRDDFAMTIASFAIIRRMICTGTNRVHRILDGDMLDNFLSTDTLYECWKNGTKYCTAQYTAISESFLKLLEKPEFQGIKDMPIGTFLDVIRRIETESSSDSPMEIIAIDTLVNGAFDFIGALVASAAELFVTKHFVDNVWDGLNIGDEITTDQGEHLTLVGFNEKGEGVFSVKED